MSLHAERVKTPLPEQLKNSFSFGNTSHNEEDGIEEESMMDDHQFEMKRTDEGDKLEDFHRSENVEEEPTNHNTTVNNSRRNRFNQDVGDQSTTDVGDESSSKKKKKRVKKKKLKTRVEEEQTEETNLTPNENISATNETTVNSTIKNDLFADMKRNHYLTISPNDIITKEVEEGDDGKAEEQATMETARNVKTQGPTSQRQKIIFIENPVSGQFRKIKETDLNDHKEVNEELVEDEQQIIEREINSYSSTVLVTNNNLFVILNFTQGLLVGFCLFHLLINIPLYNQLVAFAEWYSSVATILQKIYMFLCSICSVLSLYILSIELRPPIQKSTIFTELVVENSSPLKRSTRTVSFVVKTLLCVEAASYLLAFLSSVIIAYADEFFAFTYYKVGANWTTPISVSDPEIIPRYVILWHILNGVRALSAIVGWVSATILFRGLRRQAETTFQHLLKQQRTINQ